MRETHNLEFNEKISNTFLKTVTAYAYYYRSRIIFGILNTGEVIG